MKQYLDLVNYVSTNGRIKTDRTGEGTRSVFGQQMRFDLKLGFPLVTTKYTHFKAIVLELLWILKGDTNIKYLRDNNCNIWNEWADENGELGPVYGAQWRSWTGPNGVTIDQISQVIDLLKRDPDSRRIVVSAWNVAALPEMALMPCHAFFQFYTSINPSTGKRELSCMLDQRSADLFLGVPFNIASYSLLVHMVAQQCEMDVGEFIWVGGDCHIYLNHTTQVETMLKRKPYELCTLILNRKPDSIFDYEPSDFSLVNYIHHPAIRAKVAV